MLLFMTFVACFFGAGSDRVSVQTVYLLVVLCEGLEFSNSRSCSY